MCDGVHWVVGMGATGISVANHLSKLGLRFSICDTRAEANLHPIFDNAVEVVRGHIPDLSAAKTITVSPGLSLDLAPINDAAKLGIPIKGDMEWFSEAIDGDIIAITGTNAKSTTTTLVYKILLEAGFDVEIGGNIGTPVLDLPLDKQLYVIECSSFGLERVRRLEAKVGAFIHFAPDHMDRYANLEQYRATKLKIFRDAEFCVYNSEDEQTKPSTSNAIAFGPDAHVSLAHDKILIKGQPFANIPAHWRKPAMALALQAAIACVIPFNIKGEHIEQALNKFKGLAHRMEHIGSFKAIEWINDSKGTNLCAINNVWQNISGPAKTILLVGGCLKEPLDSLKISANEHVRAVVGFGKDGAKIASSIANFATTNVCDDLEQAVVLATELAMPGDTVILCPGGSSFDAFANFAARGEAFSAFVRKHTAA